MRPRNDPLERRALRRIEGELRQLRAPVDKIFEQQLKPRLRQLLTGKQRKTDRPAAEEQAA